MSNGVHLAENWALEIADDCTRANNSIIISALSLQLPKANAETPFSKLWKAWIEAEVKGVSVEFFLAAPTKAHPATTHNGLCAEKLFDSKIITRFVPQPNLLHAKSVIIDRCICWIGSGNMTAAAAHYNHELYVRFVSPEIAEKIINRWYEIANPR